MEELNLGLLIYFYSIWDNIINALGNIIGWIIMVTIIGAIASLLMYGMGFGVEEYNSEEVNEINRQGRKNLINFCKSYMKFIIPIFLVILLIKTILPPKEYIPLIMFSDDVASGVVESLESGKLQKINEIFELKIEETLKNLKGEN